MPEVPMASAKALGVTKGKAFRSGLVFINGKYLPPPYVVSRWGTGLRINNKPVTGQVINWTEFLKTQSGVKVSRSEAPAAAEAPASASEPEAEVQAESDDSDTSLDDLFDDDPKPKKKVVKRSPVPRKTVAKPRATVSYSLDGSFVPNDASKVLLNRINAARTEVDRTLRSGGFICFGDNYQRVSGDSRTAKRLLDKIPEMQRDASSAQSFTSMVRNGGMVYFTDELCHDLYRNRIDYRKLMDRREQWKKDQQMENFLKDVGTPLF
jgi:hypothetical protein